MYLRACVCACEAVLNIGLFSICGQQHMSLSLLRYFTLVAFTF